MVPAKPPLPTARNLRFQFVGIHNSKRMSGEIVAATRQKAGTLAVAAPPRPPGTWNDPAGTEAVRVIVVLGRASLARLSQGCWAKESVGRKTKTARARRTIGGPPNSRSIHEFLQYTGRGFPSVPTHKVCVANSHGGRSTTRGFRTIISSVRSLL